MRFREATLPLVPFSYRGRSLDYDMRTYRLDSHATALRACRPSLKEVVKVILALLRMAMAGRLSRRAVRFLNPIPLGRTP